MFAIIGLFVLTLALAMVGAGAFLAGILRLLPPAAAAARVRS